LRTANGIPPASRASVVPVSWVNRASRSELGVSGKYGGVELLTSGRAMRGGGAFWIDSTNRENGIHVIIIRLREMVVIQSEVKIR
jgi:hypothetical protein